MQEETAVNFVPNPDLFLCKLCKEHFDHPVTLACGHTFCRLCVAGEVHSPQENSSPLVPLCPQCRQIIWRPLSQLKDNVVITNLMSRYGLSRKNPRVLPLNPPADNHHHHILLECIETNALPMPSCFSQVVFSTAFIDEIIEQQSQTNPVILRWPDAPPRFALAGRISRPQVYHYTLRNKPYQTTFRAQLEGQFYVLIEDTQVLSLQTNSSNQGQIAEAPLTLCRWRPCKSNNTLNIQRFRPFFNVYDQLNNPIYLRQIAQLVDQKVLNERSDPGALIYCVLRVLRMKEKQRRHLVEAMDDEIRWTAVQDYLQRQGGKPAIDIIKVDIPGNYPHEFMFILLFLLLILYYLFHPV